MYTPIIRSRQAEILAIKALAPAVRSRCIPLVDLATPTKNADQLAAESYVQRNIARMKVALHGFQSTFIDSTELDPGFRIGRRAHPLIEGARSIAEAGCIPIPVTGLHRDASHTHAVLKVRDERSGGTLCIRLDATDVATASLSAKQLVDFLTEHSVDAENVSLLLDLQTVFGEDVDLLASQVLKFLAKTSAEQWRSVIVAGYGIPDQLSEVVPVRGQAYVRRVERDIFLRVATNAEHPNIWFGDYTVVPPTQVELDWRLIARVMSPKATYALPDSWFIVRGSPFSSHADGYGQYRRIASEIVALGEFCGAGYSSGDDYISDCASGTGSTGNPRTWITACVNHHVTLSANSPP